MKVRVKQSFKDKYTGERYRTNDEMEITNERYEEIQEKGDLVEKIINGDKNDIKESTDDNQATSSSESKMVNGHMSQAELETWKYNEIKKLAKDMKLDCTGKKEELIDRICSAEVLVEPEEKGEKQNEES